MNVKKRLTATRNVLLLAASCIAFVPLAAHADKNKPVIGFAIYGMPSWVAWGKQGAEKVAAANNAELLWVSANMDVNTQISQIQQFINRKVDVIIVGAVNSATLAPQFEAARKAGVPVVGVNMAIRPPSDALLTSYVGPDDVGAGVQVANQVISKIGGKGNVVVLQGPIGQSAEVDRTKGIKQALEKAPGVKVLSWQVGKWDRTLSYNVTQDWLSRFGGQINGIIAENDDMAIGAAQALKAKGLDGKIALAGIDGIKDGMREVQGGAMVGTSLQNAALEMGEAVQVAVDFLQGRPYPKQALLHMIPVDKSNVQKYYDQLYTNPNAFLERVPSLVKENLKSGDLTAQ
ncbi:substrate-binding domain-containing protein [Burkholderia anthina]|uniref:substrate-binding domain-containing protein n=1 Tax=Burkholderia anthina TaxID=179879 RepID=UPI00158DF268|nr:substrate-binding domain-containing protein [Burkholderia anthina]